MDGCPLANQSLQSKVAQPHQEITPTVQCCTGAGECIHTTNDTDTEHCADKLNYHAAAIKCMGDNARLCTKEELLSVKATGCCKQGCDNPHELIWTSSGNCHHDVCCCRNVFANFFHLHLSPILTRQHHGSSRSTGRNNCWAQHHGKHHHEAKPYCSRRHSG